MRLCAILLAAVLLLAAPVAGLAANCTAQAELAPADRSALAAEGLRLSQAVVDQDLAALKADLLASEEAAWPQIGAAVSQAQPLLQGGQIQLRSLYLLDAGSQTAPADTQFFCSNASGSLTVTIFMRGLQPGRYAVILADAVGAPLAGQLGIVLAWDAASSAWKLGGLTVRQGAFHGHDGVWYWQRARSMIHEDPWSAWFSYDIAHYLLLPVDFLSSPNLEKLRQEQTQIASSPQNAFPLSLREGDRTWKIDSVVFDPSLREPDLGIAYDSTGVTDPAALRTEATAVMSAFLKLQPGLRASFHGLWAYSVKDGKPSPVMELPMDKIP